ncbi:MAG: class I SAM-dependent methyltransferase [Kangiellaceae bacterium]|jgi:SAM-dependent methyltransferase|nr:class I SAM-dependent methyltransferase [Kangiellaceae bacterium]
MAIKDLLKRILGKKKVFTNSEEYWKKRYASGGNSGDGSYRNLALFKADFLNTFVSVHNIQTVLEFGCGDGNQLSFASYPNYIGYDVSADAVNRCKAKFENDHSKSFFLVLDYAGQKANLSISLDVIYHLVEDEVFEQYMNRLFDSSDMFVIIYSSNSHGIAESSALHVRHRKFSEWVDRNKAQWRLVEKIPNKYPYNGDTKTGSFADFYVYEKR